MTNAHASELEARLVAHLDHWLGCWPPGGDVVVAGSALREQPGWDGSIRSVAGVSAPIGTVISLPPRVAAPARAIFEHVEDWDRRADQLGQLIGIEHAQLRRGVFRACRSLVADQPDLGEWVSPADPRVPEWLQPFNGDVLVYFDSDGNYAAGVGRKRHDEYGQEIAVGTEEAHRGKGLAKALVATAARRIYDEGAIATYLHSPDNLASARVAESVGFPDLGWQILGLMAGRN